MNYLKVSPSRFLFLLYFDHRKLVQASPQAVEPADDDAREKERRREDRRKKILRLSNHLMSKTWAISGLLFVGGFWYYSYGFGIGGAVFNAIAGLASDAVTEYSFEHKEVS